MEDARTLLRHALATLAYRAGKTLREAPEGFATFSSSPSAASTAFPRSVVSPGAVRTPLQILAHMGDLIEWALSTASGAPTARDRTPLQWTLQVNRFFTSLERFEAFLASRAALAAPPARLFQGPIADAFTHVGQLALLRRECGAPIEPESYFDADIAAGRVGLDQVPPAKSK